MIRQAQYEGHATRFCFEFSNIYPADKLTCGLLNSKGELNRTMMFHALCHPLKCTGRYRQRPRWVRFLSCP